MQQTILDEVGGTILSESRLVTGSVAVDTEVTVDRPVNIISIKKENTPIVKAV